MSSPSLNRIISAIVRTVPRQKTAASFLPVLPVLVVVGLAGYFYAMPDRSSSELATTQLPQEIVDRIEQHLSSELAIADRIVTNNTDAIALGLLSLDDLSRWEPYLKRQIQQASSLSTIAIANADGELVSIKKIDDRVFAHASGGTPNSSSNPPLALPPWYEMTLQARQPMWSETSLEGTPTQRAIGITKPVYDIRGKLGGVVACFLSLGELDDFLQTLPLGQSGRALILDSTGRTIATSVESGESDRLTQAAATHITERFNAENPRSSAQTGEFEVRGQRQFLWVLPFVVDRGIDWTIAVVLPASDFTNPTDARTRTIFGLGLLAIPLAAIAGAYIGRQFPPLTDSASSHPEPVPPENVAAAAPPESPGDRSLAVRAATPPEYPTFHQGNRRAVVPAWQPGTPSIEFPVSSLSYDRDSSDRPTRILVVDDDPTALATLTEYLSSAQYKIFQASSSLEAIERIEQNLQPDLILFDVSMADLDGYQFCHKIRERFRFYELPIVILTEPIPDATTTEVLDWGANDYLTKPIVKHELVSRVRTHLHLAHLNAAYSRFVPKQFLQLLQKDSIVDVKLGDNTLKEMSILFCDIRSFTTISEKMTPEENFRFINSYLSRMEPVIMANRGFIDKYIGDSIMALFSGSADDAIQAGISMLHTLVEYNQHRANVGYPPVKIGIGINTGSLMLGTVGGINRMDGTVISDAVNLASRIESLTKEYGVSLLISHQTFAKLQNPSNYNMRLIERLKVKGKSKSVAVFEIFDGDPPPLREAKLATAGIFEEGVLLYYGSSFRKAAHQFEECLRQNPEDKVAQIYLDRCRQHHIT